MPETPSVPFQTAPADKQQSRDSFAGGDDDSRSLAKEFLRNAQGREQTDFILGGEAQNAVCHTGLHDLSGRLAGFQPEHQAEA